MALINAVQARKEVLGGIAHPTLWRWEKTIPDFPKPLKIGGKKFFKREELEEFIETRAQRAA